MALQQITSDMITDANVLTQHIANQNVTPAKLSQPFTIGTLAASTSGTLIDFTGIPSCVKRITVMFNGVSTSGTSVPIVQIGPTAAVETTGYLGSVQLNNVPTGFSNGFMTSQSWAATVVAHGTVVIQLLDSSTNTWSASINIASSDSARSMTGAGTKALAGTLARLRITTVAGTDTFDAGSINILYE